MDTVAVNFNLLNQGAEDLRTCANSLQNALDDLRASTQPLVASWVGSNSQAAAQWHLVEQDMQRTIDGLAAYATTFSQRVQTASADQAHMENQIANSFVV